jgi:hypothetical protein
MSGKSKPKCTEEFKQTISKFISIRENLFSDKSRIRNIAQRLSQLDKEVFRGQNGR